MNIADPTFEWFALSPVLAVLAAACLGVLAEAFLPQKPRYYAQLALAEIGLLGGFALLVWNWSAAAVSASGAPQAVTGAKLAMGALVFDPPSYLFWGALLVFGALAVAVFGERAMTGATAFAASVSAIPGSQAEADAIAAKREHTEVFPLALFSLTGMMVFGSAGDLLTMFVALEVMSLPLYLLSGMGRRRRLFSQEAALKYFLLGSFASAFFLFGMALLYGYSGSFDFAVIDTSLATSEMNRGILLAGLGLMAVGLLFKMGVVPFQSWVPDVYAGAPTPVTGFMAICTKLAAAAGLARVFFVALGGERWSWQPVFAVLAIATMAVGVILALSQTDLKRLLAYSAISHAGFLLTAVVGAYQFVPEGQLNSLGAIFYYLVAYGFATIPAFAIITTLRDTSGGEATDLAKWSGLGKSNPLLAGIFSLLLLSFAGIPLTAGFIGKWAVFAAAWQGGFWWLAITGIGFSLVAAYVYIKVIVAMFFGEPAEGVQLGQASMLTWLPISLGAIGTLWLGLFPAQLMDLIAQAQVFVK
ncbi:MAG: NADH-quinone oxidoreductase subunit NuoN [Propionibacteriaceae bacterium]|jgi:NADH-quinone oxidoreductase subunit N|nr:NADH-quinone oxidoreductase subunit NuoN [Propionibacteriaceae bacterium]